MKFSQDASPTTSPKNMSIASVDWRRIGIYVILFVAGGLFQSSITEVRELKDGFTSANSGVRRASTVRESHVTTGSIPDIVRTKEEQTIAQEPLVATAEKATEKTTEKPTESPTEKPTEKPTDNPTDKPTDAPVPAPADVNSATKMQQNPSGSSHSSYAFTEKEMDVMKNTVVPYQKGLFNKHQCMPLENVCLQTRSFVQGDDKFNIKTKTNWFYMPSKTNSKEWQPDFLYKHGIGNKFIKEPYFEFSRENKPNLGECKMSPIPNHVIVNGLYIQMVFEFFVRIVRQLFEVYNDMGRDINGSPELLASTQFHMCDYGNNKVKHHAPPPTNDLLIASLSSLPVKNYVDLFKPERNQDGGYVEGVSSRCECFERLVFCSVRDVNEKGPSGVRVVEPHNEVSANAYGSTGPKIPRHFSPQEYNEFVLKGVQNRYPKLDQKTKLFKRSVIKHALKSASLDPETPIRLDEWKLIGFAQRAGRRRWLNLPSILEQCAKLVPQKIACVEVNMDTPKARKNQDYQVVMHAGLDSFITIHGSQEVHGVWLKEGASVLELLPHVIGSWGLWTKLTKQTTANGKIFKKTRTNYFGYPLNAASIPDCSSPEYDNIEGCNDEKNWADRWFLVDFEIVETFINKFVMGMPIRDGHANSNDSGLPRCKEYEKRSMEEFVLYNVNCISDGNPTTESYYRPRYSFPHLNTTEARRL